MFLESVEDILRAWSLLQLLQEDFFLSDPLKEPASSNLADVEAEKKGLARDFVEEAFVVDVVG